MQRGESRTTRRSSILKTRRRSRSLSPSSPTIKIPQQTRRSRRISFSGKNNVREFLVAPENKGDTIWTQSYEEANDHNVNSNEQITLQSTAATCLEQTKNDSMLMDCSFLSPPVAVQRPTVFSQLSKSLNISKPLIHQSKNQTLALNESIEFTEKVGQTRPSVLQSNVTDDASASISIEDKENFTAASDEMNIPMQMPERRLQLFKMPGKVDRQLNRNTSVDMLIETSRRTETSSDNSMDLTFYDAKDYAHHERQSVICKSPSKCQQNQSVFAMDQTTHGGNTMQMTFHQPLTNETIPDLERLRMVEKAKPNEIEPPKIDEKNNKYMQMFNTSSMMESKIDDSASLELKTDESANVESKIDKSATVELIDDPVQSIIRYKSIEEEEKTVCGDISIDKTVVNDEMNIHRPSNRYSVAMEQSIRNVVFQSENINASDKENIPYMPSPQPTKRFDLNKTPYAYNANLSSSIDHDSTLTNDDMSVGTSGLNLKQQSFAPNISEKEVRRQTEYLDENIGVESGNKNTINESIPVNMIPIKDVEQSFISASSPIVITNEDESLIIEQPSQIHTNIDAPATSTESTSKSIVGNQTYKDTSIERLRRSLTLISSRCSAIAESFEMPNSSVVANNDQSMQLSSRNASSASIEQKNDAKSRQTIYGNISMQCDNSLHYVTMQNELEQTLPQENSTVNANMVKELTFIDDQYDDHADDDYVSNTKFDLHVSDEESDKMSQSNDSTLKHSSMEVSGAGFSLAPKRTLEESAFKKSDRLRYSNVGVSTVEKDILSDAAVAVFPVLMPPPQKPPPKTSNLSVTEPGQSSTIRCSSTGIGNETSFLRNVHDIKPSEILSGLDFSCYDKFEGICTTQEFFNDINVRCKQLQRELESDSDDTNAEVDMLSQNVPAPSWLFLYRNKIEEEDEEIRAQVEREFAERSWGAPFPGILDISILTRNKCAELENWDFDDLWYFRGNIHLRNKLTPVFKIVILYDGDIKEIDRHVEIYDAIKFKKVVYRLCHLYMERDWYQTHLIAREITSKIPRNLTSLCPTSADLSSFDHRMHAYCEAAYNKVIELEKLCAKSHALIEKENDSIYIWKVMMDFKNYESTEYVIDINDIDSTDWRNVHTSPVRMLNKAIEALPKGMAFLREFLPNDTKYVPFETPF